MSFAWGPAACDSFLTVDVNNPANHQTWDPGNRLRSSPKLNCSNWLICLMYFNQRKKKTHDAGVWIHELNEHQLKFNAIHGWFDLANMSSKSLNNLTEGVWRCLIVGFGVKFLFVNVQCKYCMYPSNLKSSSLLLGKAVSSQKLSQKHRIPSNMAGRCSMSTHLSVLEHPIPGMSANLPRL